MLSATLAVLALTGLIGPSKTSDVQWHKDYSSAMKLAIEQHKPLAVFITKGYTDSLKKISSDSAKILRSDYVVVVIDSEDADGKKLASIFELNVGVVVSDRTGEKQALHSRRHADSR